MPACASARVLGIRRAARREQKLVGVERLLARFGVHRQRDPAFAVRGAGVGPDRPDVDALALEGARQGGCDLGLGCGQEPAPRHNGDLGAGAGEDLRQLDPDIAAAHDDQRTRLILKLQYGRAVVVAHRIEAGDVGHMAARAGGDDDFAGRDNLAADRQRARLGERRGAFQIGDAVVVRQDADVFRCPQVVDQRLLLPDEGAPVGDPGLCLDPLEATRRPGRVHYLHRPDHRLRGDAANIDTGAADHPVADQGDAGAVLRGGDRGREPGGAGPDHGEVERPVSVSAAVRHGCFLDLG